MLPFYSGETPASLNPSPGFASISPTWLQNMAGTVSSWVRSAGNPIKSVTQPVQTIADTTAKAVDKSITSVASGFKIGTVILVLLAGLLALAYIRPFLPSSSK